MKSIKPGVLSKIFILAEKDPKDIKDLNMKKLCEGCKGMQESLLEFANNKPLFYLAKKKDKTEKDRIAEKNF